MRQIFILSIIIFLGLSLSAQTNGISINQTGNDPDSSAVLDVQSTDKGLLTPRMTSNERNAITNPADGLIVYDLDTQTFWYFDNGIWNEIRNGNTRLSYQDLIDTTFSCDQQVSELGLANNPGEITFDGHYAYVISGTNERIDIIDICNPLSPSKKGGLVLSSGILSPSAIAAYGNYLYIGSASGSSNMLAVYDVSDPMNPVFSSFVPAANAFNFRDLKIKGNLLIGVGSDGLAIFDITNPASPNLLSSPQAFIGLLDVLKIKGDYAFCSQTTYDKLEIYDISNPSNPVHITSTLIGGDPEDIELVGSYLYILDQDNKRLRSFNIENPFSPQEADSLQFSHTLVNLTAIGNKLFVTMNNPNPIVIIDVSKPGIPLLENTISLNGSSTSYNFEAYGEFAYLCDAAFDGVRIIQGCIPKAFTLDPATGAFTLDDIGSDDQTLSLSGHQLGIEDGNEVDLSALFEDVSLLTDSDEDTRIEVEQNPDEDEIRFTTNGEEKFLVNESGIFSGGSFTGTGKAAFSGAGTRFIWMPGRSVFRVGETVGSGWDDLNLAFNSSVLGGRNNNISGGGQNSTIAGGKNNSLTESFSFLGSGTSNTVSGTFSFLGAGNQNHVSGDFGFIGGGKSISASGEYSAVAGGRSNQANGQFSAVSGGDANIAAGRYSFIGGGIGNTAHSYGEIVLGTYATTYPPVSDTLFENSDRLFVIGNGADNASRSNALTILKNGHLGLGTNSPDTTLHLAGKFKYDDGNQIDGAVLTSGSDGIASWNNGLVLKNGKIGIGTNTPSHLLTIEGNTWNQGDLKIINSSNTAAGISLQSTATGGRTYSILSTGTGYLGIFDQTASTYRLTISPGGNMGIGTINPVAKLHVDGTTYVNGNLGIGTANPTKAKLEVNGSEDYLISSGFGFFNSLGQNGFVGSPSIGPYSIYASSRIAAAGFNAHSDIRIKNIQAISNSKIDLATLMNIEVTDYQMRDTITQGNGFIKKVIAQQVAEVYPQAVTSNLTEVVPDIYQRAEIQDGWIKLETNLEIGEKVKIITEENSGIYEVSAIGEGCFRVNELNSSIPSGQAFIYGREVDDFHTVDYEALSMLNISATQEQQRIIETQKEEIESLRKRMEKLQKIENRLNRLEALLKTGQ